MAEVYKNLVLSKTNILFDLNTRKIYKLDKNYAKKFKKMKNNKGEEDFPVAHDNVLKIDLNVNTIKINMCNCCNLKCQYCFANEGTYNHTGQFLSKSTCNSILQFIEKCPSIEYITFFGGEPFLNYEHIQYLCKEIKEINPNIKFLLQTNGTIMNEEIKKMIEMYNIQITLSIDGFREDNDRNRIYKNNKGTYDDIISNFTDLKQYIVAIEATWDGKSRYSKLETAKYLYEIFKCDRISICDLFKTDKKFENVNEELKQLKENPYYLNNDIKKFIANFVSKKNSSTYCSAGSGLLQIDADGKIYPCHLLIDKKDKYCLGNVNDLEFDDLLKKREIFLQNMTKDNNQCRSCVNRWNCSPCFSEHEGINWKLCKSVQNRTLENFDLIGEEIEKGNFNEILKSVERTTVYV